MKSLIRLHAMAVSLYPAGFREEFSQEMRVVFAESVAAAKSKGYWALLTLFWRELVDLPAALWQQYRNQYDKRGRGEMKELAAEYLANSAEFEPVSPASRIEILAGILPFVLFGLMYTLKGVGYHNPQAQLWLKPYWYLIVHTLLVVGLGFGWAKEFPRWSYSYLGVTLMSAWWQSQTRTYGLQLLGYTFGRDSWRWRAWVPLLAMAVAMLLLTRSLRPLAKLARDIWRDWTLLSFSLYAVVMWTMLGVTYDGKTWYEQTLYLPLNLLMLTLLIVGGAALYMRSQRPWQQVLALQGALILYFPLSALGVGLDGRFEYAWRPDSVVWWLLFVLPWFTLMFFPGILGLIRKAVQTRLPG